MTVAHLHARFLRGATNVVDDNLAAVIGGNAKALLGGREAAT